jgi:hypothetical protein
MIDPSHNRSATTQRVTAAIANASARTGVSFDYLMDQARIESGMRPDARASTSSATGLYQFTSQTWLGTVKKHGAAHDLGWAAQAITSNRDGTFSVGDGSIRTAILDMRNDPEAAAAMAAEFASDNQAHLQTSLNIDTQPVDLYLAHFLGGQGATRFLGAYRDNPDQAAAPLFPAAAKANRAVFYHRDGAARSLSEIRDNFARKLGTDQSVAPDGSGQGRTTIASTIRTHGTKLPALTLSSIEPMPKRLDLNFAQNAYRRLSGISA